MLYRIILVFIFFVCVVMVALGYGMTKITVNNLVSVDTRLQQCAQSAVRQHYDNLFEHWAIALGDSRIVQYDENNGVLVESFTLFRIPVGMLLGQPDAKLGVFCGPTGEPISIRVIDLPLRNGKSIQGLGRFDDSPVNNGLKSYHSDVLNIAFKYPDTNLLFENFVAPTDKNAHYVLTIAPEISILETIARLAPSEWPPSIRLYFYHEPTLSVANTEPLDYLESWLGSNTQLSFYPSDAAENSMQTTTTVAGMPALSYKVGGLYNYEYVAFTYNEWVVLANAAYQEENTSKDFETILESITFTP